MWAAWVLQAFRALYEEVGLGWVYAITNHQPVSYSRDKLPTLFFVLVLIFHVCCISASGKMDLDGGMHGFTCASFMIMSVNNWPGLTLKLCSTHIQFRYVILVWLQLWLCLQWASIADALYSFWAKYRLPVTGVSLSFLSMYLQSFCQCD